MMPPRQSSIPAAPPQDVSGAEDATQIVSTDMQRRALEEMSQHLLDELNTMVEQQERRAREFAARTHSLSSLPQDIPTGVASAATAVVDGVLKRRVSSPPPLVVEQASPVEETYTFSGRLQTASSEEKTPKEQSKFGFWPMIFVWILIILAIRACS